jgi:hypothetical protein
LTNLDVEGVVFIKAGSFIARGTPTRSLK